MPKWTFDQTLAIKADTGVYLVAAGAGSGKTAVLSERVKELISSGKAKISEFLILTFTNDAASEMKKRIYSKLKEDVGSPLCQKAADDIESSCISTFDALFYQMVQNYGVELGLGAGIAIDGNKILSLEKKKVLEKMKEERYLKGDPQWLSMVYRYCMKGDEYLSDKVLDILAKAQYAYDRDAWLDQALEMTYGQKHLQEVEDSYYNQIKANIDLMDELVNEILSSIEENPKTTAKLQDYMKGVNSALKGGLKGLFECEYPGRIPLLKNLDEYEKSLWERFGAANKFVRDALKAYPNIESFREALVSGKQDVAYLIEMAKELLKRMEEVSARSGLYDFADIALLDKKAVALDKVAREIRKKYRYVMVDEYQDTNNIQEAFLDALGIENRFMVGDAKQCIYAFRNANVSLFIDKKEKAQEGKNNINLITLKDNFRSRAEILEAINNLFLNAMSKELGGIDYDGSECLACGNPMYKGLDSETSSVKGYIIDSSSYVGPDPYAQWLANDIIEKLKEGYPVFDRKENRFRPCQPKDFAILLATKERFNAIKRALEKKRIPCFVQGDAPIVEMDEAMLVTSICKMYTSLRDHKETTLRHAYVSIKRSFLYMESDQKIYEDVTSGAYKQDKLILEAKKHMDEVLNGTVSSAYAFIRDFYNLDEGILKKKKTRQSLTVLDGIGDMADCLDRLGHRFDDLASYIEDLKKYKADNMDFSTKEAGDAVTVTSIHKSKGLEYPIVYLTELEKAFNNADYAGEDFVDLNEGICLKSLTGCANPLASIIIKKRRKETKDERMRLLYVALTRAEQDIIFLRNDNRRHDMEVRPKINTFRDFLALGQFNDWTPSSLEDNGLIYEERHEIPDKIPMDFRKIEPEPLVEKEARPSKESLFYDQGALYYGRKLHRYMELIDFHDIDLGFIDDPHEKEKIEKAIALKPFIGISKAKVYKEYDYISEGSQEGIVDLLAVYEDHADIIDYKAKDIDDESYIRQVKAYMDHVQKAFGLPTKGYLVSLSQATYKVVE